MEMVEVPVEVGGSGRGFRGSFHGQNLMIGVEDRTRGSHVVRLNRGTIGRITFWL